MRKLFAASLCLLALAAAGHATAAGLGPYRGSATGHQFRARETNDGTTATINRSTYAGHFSYSFNVDRFGTVSGSGTGAFDSILWHLQGSGPDPEDNYNCDYPVTGAGFTVEVTGFVDSGVAHVRFALANATETHQDGSCGALAITRETTSYLAESLQQVQGSSGEVLIELDNPTIGNLTYAEGTVDTRRVESNWNITIAPPPPPEDIGRGNAGPGGATGPSDPRADICTIKGTNRRNVLNGTPGNDIICAFGGNDTVNGRGGDDIIFGGPGNDRVIGAAGKDSLYGNSGDDRLIGRDGKKDLLDGGPGRDTVTRDRIDRVRGVP